MIKVKRFRAWSLESSDQGLEAQQEYGELKGKKIIKIEMEKRVDTDYVVFYEDNTE